MQAVEASRCVVVEGGVCWLCDQIMAMFELEWRIEVVEAMHRPALHHI